MITFILSLLTTFSFAQQNVVRPDVVETLNAQRNYVLNPSAQKNLSNVTTSSATVTRDTTTNNKIDGNASFICDTSSSAGYCRWVLGAILKPDDLATNTCEASAFVKGDATLYTLQITDGTNVVGQGSALTNYAEWTKISVAAPCGATRDVRFTQTTAGVSPAVNVARVSYGPVALFQISQSTFVGGMEQVGAVGCTYSESTSSGVTDFVSLGAATGCNAWTVTGAITSVGNNDHRVQYNNMPPGNYLVVVSGAFNPLGSGSCRYRLSDGTNSFQAQSFATDSAFTPNLVFHASYTTGGNRTLTLQASDNISACRWYNEDAGLIASWKIYRFPTANEAAVRADTAPFVWSGYHDTTCSWTRSSTTFGDFGTDSTCDLVQLQNTGAGSVASSSGTLPGIVFSPNSVGQYEICAIGTVDNDSGAAVNSLRLQNVTLGETMSEGRHQPVAAGSPATVTLCGIHNASTLASQEVRVQGAATSGGVRFLASTPVVGTLYWTVRKLTQNIPMPVMVGSVGSNSSGLERIERVSFGGSTEPSVCSTTPCTIYRQSGSWVSSVSRSGAGLYTLNINTGIFSAPPTCVSIVKSASGSNTLFTAMAQGVAPTATAVSLLTANTATAAQDGALEVICMGPR